ncbi:MAG: glutamate formimidoyltransferase [Candidatus Eremiobacteraeota bacterium]|nr:glutamate formimidoyltransferase [Candidatus Eremiobacteraeota bacterium]MBV9973026.1 glutamate formimidoyltransferase [Candidatus Eremiobacteraeota bacterium]
MALFECVPNISEGRRHGVIDACVQAVTSAGAKLLHRTSDSVHNRSVLTIAGDYRSVRDAGVALAGAAVRLIDMRSHRGVHPRIGALDVLPIIPLRDTSMAEAVALARDCGERIWDQFRIPSFLYGHAASTPERRDLSAVRTGQFEGLQRRFERPEWQPDFGDPRAHDTAGAIAIGARDILIAFNVELATADRSIATRIAKVIRARDGGLRTLRALGLQRSRSIVQVSLNVSDYRATPLYRIVELIRALAAEDGVSIVRSELIGCIPAAALAETARYYLGLSE